MTATDKEPTPIQKKPRLAWLFFFACIDPVAPKSQRGVDSKAFFLQTLFAFLFVSQYATARLNVIAKCFCRSGYLAISSTGVPLLFEEDFMKNLTLIVGACVLVTLGSSIALAGECPADKVGQNSLANAPTAPVGVVDKELASIDLSKENVKLLERRLRLRTMTIASGGIVPLHSHADRPALIKVVSGEIYENSSKCLVPILHKAGDVARESLGTQHWWKNEGTQPVELTIGDVVNDKMPATMPPMM